MPTCADLIIVKPPLILSPSLSRNYIFMLQGYIKIKYINEIQIRNNCTLAFINIWIDN